MRVKLDSGAVMPTKSYLDDAGWDLYALEDDRVPQGGYAVLKTGVHLQIPKGYFGLIQPRSSWSMRGLITAGVVDAGFTGDIRVSVINGGDADKIVRAGDRIAQICIVPVLGCALEPGDELDPSERGDKGYGSTGR